MANQTILLGSEQLKAALAALGAQAPRVLASAFLQEAEVVMEKAKELTPVDSGNLKSTGRVIPPVLEGDTLTVTLTFGGPAANGEEVHYAVYVHENLTARHPVGEAKFLERPVLEWADVAEARLAAHVGKAIEEQARAAR
jgi:hypothetical protein